MSEATPEFIQALSEKTGVPEVLLRNGGGDTIDSMWDFAEKAVSWATATSAPQPATSAAVPVPSMSRAVDMRGEAPDDWMSAWRSGKLDGMGAPAPGPRRNGEAHRNAGP